jgi:DNA-directed RNA polymerase subunit E'/Rpb7
MTIIKQKVYIEPSKLDCNIEDHVFSKLKSSMEGICTSDHGYIISVNKLLAIADNSVGTEGTFIIFNVTYEADTITPFKGLEVTSTVCMVFDQGILSLLHDKIKIFIPNTSLKSYLYKELDDEPSFVNKKSKKVITNNSEILVEIVIVKYEENNFSCIGKLVK